MLLCNIRPREVQTSGIANVRDGSSKNHQMNELRETNACSFIVKVWLEETVNQAGKVLWRGHITHVLSDKRHYLQDLYFIPEFIAPYLEGMGVKFNLRWRIMWWLCKWRVRNPG